VLHPDDQSQVVSVRPPLTPPEVEVVAGLAGVGPGPRRLWPGQPGRRSPWLPCAGGCCLVAEERPCGDPATWLRFLVRELLAPVARDAVARAAQIGLPGGHRVEGEVLLGAAGPPRLLVAAGRRVRVAPLDDDLLPLAAPRPRHRGEVVELADHLTTEERRRRQRTER
jgi:hypothetical protein